jgi:hypothetical protein
MQIKGDNLWEVWKNINFHFIGADPDVHNGFYLPKGRDYTLFKSDFTLRCRSLGGLPENVYPLFEKERRIKLLTRKYLNESLWEEGVRGLRRATSFPKSFLLQFRLSNPKLETGKGGGCLIGLVFSWIEGKWNLHVYSRVTEVTVNLLADMYFIQFLIKRLIEDGDLQGVEFSSLNTIWNIALVNQKRDRIPLFFLFAYGDGAAEGFMLDIPHGRWQRTVKKHFWDIFIYPEKINWAQRKRWSLKFKETSHRDWPKIKERYYEDISKF